MPKVPQRVRDKIIAACEKAANKRYCIISDNWGLNYSVDRGFYSGGGACCPMAALLLETQPEVDPADCLSREYTKSEDIIDDLPLDEIAADVLDIMPEDVMSFIEGFDSPTRSLANLQGSSWFREEYWNLGKELNKRYVK